MTEPVIALRRNEPISLPGGYPTTRFSRYIESATNTINASDTDLTTNTEAVENLEFIEFWRT